MVLCVNTRFSVCWPLTAAICGCSCWRRTLSFSIIFNCPVRLGFCWCVDPLCGRQTRSRHIVQLAGTAVASCSRVIISPQESDAVSDARDLADSDNTSTPEHSQTQAQSDAESSVVFSASNAIHTTLPEVKPENTSQVVWLCMITRALGSLAFSIWAIFTVTLAVFPAGTRVRFFA